MAVAGVSTRAMEPWNISASFKHGGEDEIGSDVDHKEMINAYACDAYLSKWLPKINDSIPEDENRTSKNNITPHTDVKPVQKSKTNARETLNIKLPSQTKRREKEEDELKDTKANGETKRKTYFEAIKCSPMKLRQSIAAQNRPKLENKSAPLSREEGTSSTTTKAVRGSVFQEKKYRYTTEVNNVDAKVKQHSDNPPAIKKAPKARSKVAPCVVEMTGGPLNQLGSLCFKTEDHERRRSVYTTCHMFSGRTRKLHASRTTIPGRKKEMLVRCESVMIYPKALVNPNTEKRASKPLFFLKKAWQDSSALEEQMLSSGDTSKKLPDLREANENVQQAEKNDIDTVEYEYRPQNAATPKIIVPFGEYDPKQAAGMKNSEKNHPLSEKDLRNSEFDSKQINNVSHRGRVSHRFPSQKSAAAKNDSSGVPRRKLSGITIGVTRLEVPRGVPLVTQQTATSATPVRSPTKAFTFRSPKVNDLFLGKENLPAQTTPSPRYLYSPRKRVDFASKRSGQSAAVSGSSDDELENSKYFLSSEVGLEIGGTGLLKDRRSSDDTFDGDRQLEDKKHVHFNSFVPHSRYFT